MAKRSNKSLSETKLPRRGKAHSACACPPEVSEPIGGSIRRRGRKATTRRAAETAREKALREKYQRTRPSLAQLRASGDFDPPVSQAEYWDLMRILARLRTLRTAAGLSLADVARRSGMDRAAISRLENAVNDNPTLETLGRYAKALGKRLVVTIADATPLA